MGGDGGGGGGKGSVVIVRFYIWGIKKKKNYATIANTTYSRF